MRSFPLGIALKDFETLNDIAKNENDSVDGIKSIDCTSHTRRWKHCGNLQLSTEFARLVDVEFCCSIGLEQL